MQNIIRISLLAASSLDAMVAFATTGNLDEAAAKYAMEIKGGIIECVAKVPIPAARTAQVMKYYPHHFMISPTYIKSRNRPRYFVGSTRYNMAFEAEGVNLLDTIYPDKTDSKRPASVKIENGNLEIILIPGDFFNKTTSTRMAPIPPADAVAVSIVINSITTKPGKLSGVFTAIKPGNKLAAKFKLECVFVKS